MAATRVPRRCSRRGRCLARWMKLKAVALGDRLNRRRIGLSAEARHVTEKLFNPGRGRGPRDVQQPGSGVAQPVPCLPRHIERRPRQDGHGFPFERRPPLPLIDEQHFILGKVAVDGDRRPGRQALSAHGEARPRAPGIDVHNHLPGRGRS